MFELFNRRLLILPLLCVLVSACGSDENDNSDGTDRSGAIEQAGVQQAVDLPSSLGIVEYNRLRDELDNDEVPLRIVHRVDNSDLLSFDSIDDASEDLIDAVADEDFQEADRVLASVPEDWRRDLLNNAHDAARDAYSSRDYAEAYRFDRYLHVDNRSFWLLESEYINGRVADTGTGAAVAGATVSTGFPYEQSTQTNTDGEFRILVPRDASTGFMVEHPDYDPKRVFNTSSGAPISIESLAGNTFEILIGTGYPKLTFRGRIVDAETGEPLAGLPVVAGFDPIEGATELNMQQVMGRFGRATDENGRFEITELPMREVKVFAQAFLAGKTYQLQQDNFRFEDGIEHVFEVQGRGAQLEIPLVVAGTVRDRVSGDPLPNASVTAGGWKTERTDQNGRFMMQLETGQDWQLTASHDEYHRGQPQPFASAEPQVIEAEFFLDPITTGTILGTAINAVTGEPIANAVIEIAGQQVTTDSQGRFRAEEIESGEVRVSAAQSGFRADSESLLLEALQTAEATLELEPITTGTITGIVVDESSGLPLEGVMVRGGEVSAATDSDGRFVLDDVEAGAISVAATMSLYVPASEDVMLEAMAAVDTELRLAPITWGTVRGTVVDSTNQQPLANATVRLGGIEISTDSDGAYLAERVPAGTVSVNAGFARYHDAQETLELPRDGVVEQSLALAPITTGTVIATIVDAVTGNPIAGADVMIGQRREAADAAGSVLAEEVPAGRIAINAGARLYEPGSAETLLEAAGESSIRIELTPVTYGTVFGTVVDRVSGAPLANANVRFAGLELQTDAQGAFRAARIPAGSVSVSAALFRYRDGQQTIDLARGVEEQVNLALEPITTGTVRGIVLSTADGQPVAGATITVGSLSARSNGEGRFEIENVVAGDATVRASLMLFEPGESSVSVEAALAVDTELRLVPITYGSINGTVVNAENGSPLANATVSAGLESTQTNAAGEFELQRVTAGEISIRASKAIHIDDSTIVALAAGGTESVTLRLEEITWGVVTGVVTDADTGRPLANADITVSTKSLRSDNFGRFRVENVPAGSLQVSGRMPAYEPGSVSAALAADGEADVHLALAPIRIGDITGTVIDAKTGEAIAQARVTTGRLSVETDVTGKFSFEAVSTGSSVVAARHPDYANGSTAANVLPAESIDVVIELDLRREDVTNLEAELAKSGTIDLYGIFFDSGRDQFKPSSLQTLRAVLEVMKRAPDRRFQIAGHTDSDGGDASNQDLSERRATTVIQWLVDNGIDGARLTGVGFGETRPAAPNDTETGKALNRRVQLSFAD